MNEYKDIGDGIVDLLQEQAKKKSQPKELGSVADDTELKVAHFTHWTPGLSGLAEASIDLVNCERRAGLNSILIDAYTENPTNLKQGELVASPWSEAIDADVWVLHKMIPPELMEKNKELKIPIVAVLHGTVQDMFIQNFLDEQTDWWNIQINLMNTYDASVCVCPYDYEVNRLYIKDESKLFYIREAVDPLRFTPEGSKFEFRFHPALIAKDTIRTHKYPFFALWSMPKVVQRIPDARLNLFCLHLVDMCKWRNFFLRSNEKGNLRGTIETLNMIGYYDITPFIRGSDITINSDYLGGQSRTVPESMMCGKPVVAAGRHNDYTKYTFDFGDSDSFADAIESCWNDLLNEPNEVRETCLHFADEHFNLEKKIPKWLNLYHKVIENGSKNRS